MNSRFHKLFWDEKKDGVRRAGLCPWLYRDHKSWYDHFLLEVEEINHDLAKEIKATYKWQEEEYRKAREELDREVQAKNPTIKVQPVPTEFDFVPTPTIELADEDEGDTVDEGDEGDEEKPPKKERTKELKALSKTEQEALIEQYGIETDASNEAERIKVILSHEYDGI